MASNSWKTYKTAVEAFIQFRLIYKFGNIWPASVDEIAIFNAFLSYKELAATNGFNKRNDIGVQISNF
jgi:hypothetical protein